MNVPTFEDIKKALQVPEIPQDRDSMGRRIHRKSDNLPKIVQRAGTIQYRKVQGKWG